MKQQKWFSKILPDLDTIRDRVCLLGCRVIILSYKRILFILLAMHFLFVFNSISQGQKKTNISNKIAQVVKPTVTGSQYPKMPNLKGLTFEDAQKQLTKYNHPQAYKELGASAEVEVGKIFDQKPKLDTPLMPNTEITLFVSTGPGTVPPIQQSADVSIDKKLVTAVPYAVGQRIEYTIIVKNVGTSAATNVRIVDSPTNLIFKKVSGACNNLRLCTIKSIAPESEVTINVAATIIAVGDFNNVVTATADETDPDPQNNTDNSDNGGTAGKKIAPKPAPTEPIPNPTKPPPDDNQIDKLIYELKKIWVWLLVVATVLLATLATVSVVTYRTLRWRKWLRLINVSSTLDPHSNSSVSPLRMESPSVAVSVHLEWGHSAVGPINETRRELKL
jgi:uncharacterized repeat protein (TIGR01451 family)